jgi:hypothetical protein
MPLVNAVKELSSEIEMLKSEKNMLELRLSKLESMALKNQFISKDSSK